MVSKSQFRLITSLEQKKYRLKHNLFFAEGIKTITELLKSDLTLHSIFTTDDIFEADEKKKFLISEAELKKISRLKTPQTALAVFQIPEQKFVPPKGLAVALDGIRDPGNLGTIIRLCDWFGVSQLYCSKDTVDCYNPKVVQASMGSITRINLSYVDLESIIKDLPEAFHAFGAFLVGENIYSTSLPKNGLVLLGNEANGISEALESLVTKKLCIPQFGEIQETESLNVATATAIFLSEFRRRSIGK